MLAAAPHRGEVGAILTRGRVAVATSDLADLGDASVADDGVRVAAVAGTIDDGRDRVSRATSDAEVLLAAWSRWGEDAPAHLRGSFAAVVSDGSRVSCIRDHLGTRPLFHHRSSDGFYVATEAKQVLAGARRPREPDLDVLAAVLYSEVGADCALRGVRRVGKAEVAVSDGGPPSVRRYFDPEPLLESTGRITFADAVEGTRGLLQRAVERCVTGRDAVLLSGGVDSPAVAAFAAPVHTARGGRPLAAVSAVYPHHPEVDERPYIEEVARRLDIELHTYEPAASPTDDLEAWTTVLDGPVDTLAIPQVAEAYRHVRRLGRTGVLTGELAEDVLDLPYELAAHLLWRGRVRPFLELLEAQRAHGRRPRRIARDLARAVTPSRVAVAYARHRRFDPRPLLPWIDPARLSFWRIPQDLATPPRRRWSEVQVGPFLGTSLTMEADEIVAATCGVRVRWPFTDIDLWTWILSLPAQVKHGGPIRKHLLRETIRGHVPERIIDRRDKTVFDTAMADVADYAQLERYLVDPEIQMPGVDYGLLSQRVAARSLSLLELRWAQNLATIHAFVHAT